MGNRFDAPVQRTALDSVQPLSQLPQRLVVGAVHCGLTAV